MVVVAVVESGRVEVVVLKSGWVVFVVEIGRFLVVIGRIVVLMVEFVI